jgi:hypothetical protein
VSAQAGSSREARKGRSTYIYTLHYMNAVDGRGYELRI